ncbi:MAG: MucB/RseB C-terminal domain-containing protein [Succinivibrio sp.]
MPELVKTACSVALFAVLFFLNPARAADDGCMEGFVKARQDFGASSVKFTAGVGDQRGMFPFAYRHVARDGREYVLWRSLNGAVAGYAMRDLSGFDFNEDKGARAPLTWHPSQVFDRLMSPKTKLQGYQCVFSGRTRLNGRKVSLIRLIPTSDQRYGFAVALDDEQGIPVEVNVTTPSGAVALKISAADASADSSPDPVLSDAEFDHFSLSRPAAQKNLEPWGFIKVPRYFTMVSEGSVQMDDGNVSPYQQFSDGLFTFRVYINSRSSLYLQEASAGTISVYRTQDANREYAVTGEIPMELARQVLSGVAMGQVQQGSAGEGAPGR